MTGAVATKISDFLRDAQAKVEEITTSLVSMRDNGPEVDEYIDLLARRESLYNFMEILNDPYTRFHDDTTTLIQGTGATSEFPAWTDREVIEEIDWLRYYGQLSYLPFFAFVGYYPQVIGAISSSGFAPGTGWNPPLGSYLQILRYDSNGVLIVTDWPDYAGARDLSVNAYFAGRS